MKVLAALSCRTAFILYENQVSLSYSHFGKKPNALLLLGYSNARKFWSLTVKLKNIFDLILNSHTHHTVFLRLKLKLYKKCKSCQALLFPISWNRKHPRAPSPFHCNLYSFIIAISIAPPAARSVHGRGLPAGFPVGLPGRSQPCAVERPGQPRGSAVSGESLAGLGCSARSLRSVADVPGRSHGSVATVSVELAWDWARFRRSSTSPKEMSSPGRGGEQQHVRRDRSSSQHWAGLAAISAVILLLHFCSCSGELGLNSSPPAAQQGDKDIGKRGWTRQRVLAFQKASL